LLHHKTFVCHLKYCKNRRRAYCCRASPPLFREGEEREGGAGKRGEGKEGEGTEGKDQGKGRRGERRLEVILYIYNIQV